MMQHVFLFFKPEILTAYPLTAPEIPDRLRSYTLLSLRDQVVAEEQRA